MDNKGFNYFIDKLNLKKHPEGGYYLEIYKDEGIIKKDNLNLKNFDNDRKYSTSIYYLLNKDDYSSFHKIKSDELWHYYYGNTCIKIYEIKHDGNIILHRLGKNLCEGESFFCYINKKSWFSAELENKEDNNFVLCGCTVSPEFEFNDFEIGSYKNLSKEYPQHKKILKRLCRY